MTRDHRRFGPALSRRAKHQARPATYRYIWVDLLTGILVVALAALTVAVLWLL